MLATPYPSRATAPRLPSESLKAQPHKADPSVHAIPRETFPTLPKTPNARTRSHALERSAHLLDPCQSFPNLDFLLFGHIHIRRPLIELPRAHLQAERVFHRAIFIDSRRTQNLNCVIELGDRLGNVFPRAFGCEHRGDQLRKHVAFRQYRTHA